MAGHVRVLTNSLYFFQLDAITKHSLALLLVLVFFWGGSRALCQLAALEGLLSIFRQAVSYALLAAYGRDLSIRS
jgi:hypothetical protein